MQIPIIIFTGLIGAAFGSFINAAVFRLANNLPIANDRSKCIHCNVQLVWWQLIPMVSYIVLQGKCYECKKSIPSRYFLVEIVTAALLIVVLIFHGLHNLPVLTTALVLTFVRDVIAVLVMVFLFLIDFQYYLLPDIITIPSTIVILILQIILGASFGNLIIAVIVGAGFFLAQYLISKGKWIGDGDIRMGALMGVILGWPNILLGLFLSYLLGAFISVPLVWAKKKSFGAKIPFGTFLAIGTVITMFYGHEIISWYLGLI